MKQSVEKKGGVKFLNLVGYTSGINTLTIITHSWFG